MPRPKLLGIGPALPARNTARFYKLSAGRSLFGDVTAVREWGRIGTTGRVRIDLFANEPQALVAYDAIGRAKSRRGYQHVGAVVRGRSGL